MKKLILLFVVLLTIPLMSQWRSVAGIVTAGDSVTAAVVIPEGYTLAAVEFPGLTAGSTTLKFDVKGQQNKATWKPLWYNGAIYSVVVSATGYTNTVEPKATFGFQTFRAVLPVEQANTDTLWFHCAKLY
jgi:hypothetical protein